MKIAIIGYGELGRAIHKILQRKTALDIRFWDKKEVSGQKSLDETVASADAVFVCVSSWCMRPALENIKDLLAKKSVVVCMAKGIEPESLKTMDVVLEESLNKGQPAAVLSGPMLAEEFVEGKGGFAAVAVKSRKYFDVVADVFAGTNLGVEYSKDLKGVALCGVFKNVYALGLGIIDGLELGNNAKGQYASMAVSETAEAVKFLGGKKETVFGPAGAGDLIATAFSPYSRNRKTGEELGRTGKCCLLSEGYKSIGGVAKMLGKKADELAFFALLKSIVADGKKPNILK